SRQPPWAALTVTSGPAMSANSKMQSNAPWLSPRSLKFARKTSLCACPSPNISLALWKTSSAPTSSPYSRIARATRPSLPKSSTSIASPCTTSSRGMVGSGSLRTPCEPDPATPVRLHCRGDAVRTPRGTRARIRCPLRDSPAGAGACLCLQSHPATVLFHRNPRCHAEAQHSREVAPSRRYPAGPLHPHPHLRFWGSSIARHLRRGLLSPPPPGVLWLACRSPAAA